MDGVKVNAKQILRSFEIHVFPKIGQYPHDETDLHMWLSLIEALAERYPAVADKVLQNTKLAHAWGSDAGSLIIVRWRMYHLPILVLLRIRGKGSV